MSLRRETLQGPLNILRQVCGGPRRSFAFVFLLALAFLFFGCKTEKETRLSPAQVHAITRQMAHAAVASAKPTEVASHLQFDGTHSRPDQLLVTLPALASDQARREAVTRLIQSLDRVATASNLSRDAGTSSGALLVFSYQHSSVITQSVHIIAPLAASNAPSASHAGSQKGARLAIILDDLGSDRPAADAIFALPYPLTISILPGHAHSTEIAEEAHRRGYQVLLHLPMQSVANETPEAQELRPGMPADEVAPLFEQMMQSVPNAVGVNNHQGSQATADPALMHELMPVLQRWNLFYVDSRTTAATVAYDTAQHAGVRSAFRSAPFLDDVADVAAIRNQLHLAFSKAKEKGEAITIGHPHPQTLQVLREELPHAAAEGVQLVFVSDLVR